jgi:hypothetical protein
LDHQTCDGKFGERREMVREMLEVRMVFLMWINEEAVEGWVDSVRGKDRVKVA